MDILTGSIITEQEKTVQSIYLGSDHCLWNSDINGSIITEQEKTKRLSKLFIKTGITCSTNWLTSLDITKNSPIFESSKHKHPECDILHFHIIKIYK